MPTTPLTATTIDLFKTNYQNVKSANTDNVVAPGTSGWGPDYGDAQSYLDTIQPYGYMTKSIGLY